VNGLEESFLAERLNRFLGDTPGRVLLKLLVMSFLLGVVMHTLGWSPLDLIDGLREIVNRIWAMGFDAIRRFADYILLGAVIVVPLFLVLRLLKFRV
jgi:hypothetical protein